MKTRTIKTYAINELSEEAKQKAIEEMRDINTSFQWGEFTLDDWKEKLKAKGFYNAKIYYSGFWSQGDGASFESGVDVAQWLKINKRITHYRAIYKDIDNVKITITKSGHYEHEMTMNVDCEYWGNNDKAYATVDVLASEILENARDYARLIYKDLQKEYEYQTSDSAIIETIEANEYEFTRDGNRSVYL